MRRFSRGWRWLALAALVAGIAAVPSALAATSLGSAEGSGGLWFVELSGKPTADGGYAASLAQEKSAFRAAAKKAGISFAERYSFSTAWNGLSIQLQRGSVAALSTISGVKSVSPVGMATLEPTETVTPELATAIQMTGADLAHADGWTGAGVKVGIVDTGIDLDHPDLGGDGVAGAPYTNTRVVSQYDFVGDAYNADPSSPAYSPTPSPDPIADDCNGHGTHVSGIVGANGGVTGVAPDVQFGAYRIFGCGGSANDDVILAALERAYTDGMDVVNMSLGDAFNGWPEAPLAKASDVLLNHGVVVVASIGNSGADGVYSNGAPGVGDGVIGVASFDNSFVNLNSATVTPAGLTVGYQNMSGTPPPPAAPFSGSLPLAMPSGNPRGCAAADWVGFPIGSMAIIRRGTCTFGTKAIRAQIAGAAAAVVYNSVPGYFSGTVGTAGVTIPIVSTSNADGVAIVAAMLGGPQTWNWGTGVVSIPNPTGGTISSFSSFGLNAELTLKPDIGAPGGLIRSTYPLESGTYATLSGTSMASPHVAGAVALLLQANPNMPRKKVRDVLQNSADPKNRFGFGYLDAAHRQGAGLLDIDDAITATTWIKPGKISLGEGNGGTKTIELTNKSGSPVTYDVSHEAAAGTTGTFSLGPNAYAYNTAYASASFSSPSVTVPAGGSATVDVTIDATAVPDKGVYGGYITFTPQGGGQEYRVPYAGFKGDYQSIQVLTDGGFGFPLLGQLTACTIVRGLDCAAGGGYTAPPAGAFTMADAFNVPQFLVHFDHQARSLTADLYRASDNKWMGVAFKSEYLPRNSGATSFFAFPWGGMVAKGNGNGSQSAAANGTYYVKFQLIKALGNPANAETWQSPNFTVARP